MARKKPSTKESDLQEILFDTAEVQLAGLRAGIDFWSSWVKLASKYAEEVSGGLDLIASDRGTANEALRRITEAGQKSIREMNELPRRTSMKFIEELDRSGKAKKRPTRTRGTATNKKRAVRAKD